MWQVLLAAAAAAGSGILAKKFINPTDDIEKPVSDFNQNNQVYDQTKCSNPQDSIFLLEDAFQENSAEENRDAISDDGKIFRFSSPQTGSKELRKKTGSGFRGLKKIGGVKRGNKSRVGEGGGKELAVDQRGKVSAKRISVCLKKRRTGKYVAGKCEPCASKDNSFGLGVGIGMMYVVSAGKAEISKLNCAMDETSKIVQELKAEISRRKSTCNVHTSAAGNEAETIKKHTEAHYSGPLFAKSKNKLKTSDPSLIEEGKCVSTVLAEEQRPEVLEMDQLEAELESELQKLPWCVTASSGSEGRPDIFDAEILAKEGRSKDCRNSNLYERDGVLPTELDNKLCHLLIEQQENQIVELESELHQANTKLLEKEAELQALKNCVKCLSEFSIASASDEEIEDKEEDVKIRDGAEENLRFVPTKSMVGMKRMMGYESHFHSSE